jgi:hypothetical protein
MTSALRRHADEVLRRELWRHRGVLVRLTPERRDAVEKLAVRTVAAAVEGIVEHARDDPRIAAALESVYGTGSVLTPAPAPGTPD